MRAASTHEARASSSITTFGAASDDALDSLRGRPAQDPVEKAVYHGQRHWWNATPAGLWVDFTPRGFKQLVLVESIKVKVPEPAADELESMRRPARRADELSMEIECNGAALSRVSLTGKQLDGANQAEPVSMLIACFAALDRALKANRDAGSPEDASWEGEGSTPTTAAAATEQFHFSLREVRVPSKDPRVTTLERSSTPVCFTPARSFLQAGSNTRVALDFFPFGSHER